MHTVVNTVVLVILFPQVEVVEVQLLVVRQVQQQVVLLALLRPVGAFQEAQQQEARPVLQEALQALPVVEALALAVVATRRL